MKKIIKNRLVKIALFSILLKVSLDNAFIGGDFAWFFSNMPFVSALLIVLVIIGGIFEITSLKEVRQTETPKTE